MEDGVGAARGGEKEALGGEDGGKVGKRVVGVIGGVMVIGGIGGGGGDGGGEIIEGIEVVD